MSGAFAMGPQHEPLQQQEFPFFAFFANFP